MNKRSACRLFRQCFLPLVFMLCASDVSNAQNDNTPTASLLVLEEIVVTARKRFEMVQDVPIAMMTVDGDDIHSNNVLKLEDFSAQIPNLYVAQATVANQLFVRGIGSGINQGFEQTVGTYVDGIYYGRGQLSRAPFYDLQRVEILKGPQGILFGKNTVAGALNIASKDPTDTFEGDLTALYEVEHQEKNINGAISGPLTDTLSARLAFRYSSIDGWLENTAKDRDEPQTEETAGRLSIAWQPIVDVELVAKLAHADFSEKGRATQIIKCSTTPASFSIATLPSLSDALSYNGYSDDCSENGRKSVDGDVVYQDPNDTSSSYYDYSKEQSDTQIDHAGIHVDWAIGDYTLTSITGYVTYDLLEFTDGDFSQLSVAGGERQEDFSQLSQEVRWTTPIGETFEHLLGLYWQTAKLETGAVVSVNLRQLGLPIPNGLNPVFASVAGTRAGYFEQDAQSWAIFAQSTWNINDYWRTTAGLRFSEETKDVSKTQYVGDIGVTNANTSDGLVLLGFAGLQSAPYGPLDDSRRESNWSPSLNVQWDINDDHMWYASISRGFKGGGFDAVLGDGDVAKFEYEEETVTALETGMKMRFLEGGATLNIALFRSDFKDVQISVYNGALDFNVTNAGKTRTQGLELDGRWRVLNSVVLSGAFAYLDAKYLKFDEGQCYANQTVAEGCISNVDGDDFQDLAGQSTQFSPEYTLNFGIEHTLEFGELQLVSKLDYLFVDDFAIANDLDPELYQEQFSKFNLRLGLSPLGRQWELALIGKNLTDERTISYASDVPLFEGSRYVHSERGRSYALQGSVYF